ncbi:MAG: 4Fe-4S binding protein [Bacteroidales bacterium]|jgi:MinD superfamily P-loop ATPase|nr:4Fe-4S binding protein [Bacteroidales bacterium]
MFWSKLIADVIEDKCCNCGVCVEICRHHALVTDKVQGKTCTFLDDPKKCTGCGRCVRICPSRAIEMVERYC